MLSAKICLVTARHTRLTYYWTRRVAPHFPFPVGLNSVELELIALVGSYQPEMTCLYILSVNSSQLISAPYLASIWPPSGQYLARGPHGAVPCTASHTSLSADE